MSLSKLFRPRILISVSLILGLAVVAFAYAAANTVPDSGAGDATGGVGGYAITAITYNLAADPSTITSISFIVTPAVIAPSTTTPPAADHVTISVDGGTDWTDCTGSDVSPNWICTFVPAEAVVDIVNLQVVAVSALTP